MRLVIQRVCSASISVENKRVGNIDKGLLVLIGVTQNDTKKDAEYLAKKTAQLRIFEDAQGKMNRSVQDVGGACLLASQFTLYGDCRKGNRPSFIEAADPQNAKTLIEHYADFLSQYSISVQTGIFAAHMHVDLVNDGPVTLLLESHGK